jgi:hypothetical protein
LALKHDPKEKRKMQDNRVTHSIYVGYSISTKQFFVYYPLLNTLHRSRDVVSSNGKRYRESHAADKEIMNKQFY